MELSIKIIDDTLYNLIKNIFLKKLQNEINIIYNDINYLYK